ncbi:MAG: DUF1697 domain-containing protein [Thermoplasmata archaeon]|nr:DUF1697 domain-containing protein [Thermoplasmata archaeon]
MVVYIALLRAVNVGGHAPLPMADLRAELTRAGFGNVRTLIQSGNIVLRSPERSGANLERRLESLLQERFSLTTVVVVRSAADWAELIRVNPHPRAAADDPARLAVVCLKAAPPPGAADALRAAIRGRETAAVVGPNAYVVYPDGTGTSRLTIAVIERALGTRGTARNWNTIRKLDGLAHS